MVFSPGAKPLNPKTNCRTINPFRILIINNILNYLLPISFRLDGGAILGNFYSDVDDVSQIPKFYGQEQKDPVRSTDGVGG